MAYKKPVEKKDKTSPLAHLGPPAIARRFGLDKTWDSKENPPRPWPGDPAHIAADLEAALKHIKMLEAENATLKVQVADLTRRLGALTEAVNSHRDPPVNKPVNVAVNAVNAPVNTPARKDMAAYMRDRRAAKKLGISVAEFRARQELARETGE